MIQSVFSPVPGRGQRLRRRRPGRAGARPARREPAGAKSGEQRARGAEGGLGPRSPARRAGLDTAAPGAGGRSASHAGVPGAPRLRQREPAPGRSRSPSGRRRRRRGGATGSATRSPGSSCGRGRARDGWARSRPSRVRPAAPRRAARRRGWSEAPATPPRLARCGDPAGRSGRSATAGRRRPGRPRGVLDQGQGCEWMRASVQGCTCPGRLYTVHPHGLGSTSADPQGPRHWRKTRTLLSVW